MGTFLTLFAEFLIKHGDLIIEIEEAIEGGATKEQVRTGIRSSMVLASDAVVEGELGPRPKS
jgi:hypothetical protein